MASHKDQPSTSSNVIRDSEIHDSPIQMVAGDFYNITISKSSEKETIPSVEELKKVQREYEEENFLIGIDETSYEQIQKIFPKIAEASGVTMKAEYKSSMKERMSNQPQQQQAKEFNFYDILDKTKQCKLLNIIGLPGVGKSTFCKRASKHFCNRSNAICILIKFMNLNFNPSDRKLTLQQLLIDYTYPKLQPEECKSAFQWICKNEENVLLIFDGYDQANWSITDNAPQLNYHEPQPVQDLVSNILNKKYFSKSRIIFSSRPHAIKKLPKSLQQNFAVQLLDLSPADMKRLFFLFAGSKATELWDKLHTHAPQLVSLCSNPLVLQLVIKVCKDHDLNVAAITSMSRIFAAVMDSLNASSHFGYIDIRNILPLLAELAFDATACNTVRISEKDVKKVGLKLKTVCHLIMSQQTDNPCHLFDGKTDLHFIHQTLQEYLTALYIRKYMSALQFRRFVNEELFSPHWNVVRQFLFGITFDLFKNEVSQQWKADLLKEKLLEKMQKIERMPITTFSKNGSDLLEVCKEVRECADEEITEAAARQFPTKAEFDENQLSNSDAHAVSLVLRKVKTKIRDFSLWDCQLNSQTFSYFVRAIKVMEGSIDYLDIGGNKLTSDDVDEICDILSKINDGLDMWLCFYDGTWGCRSASEEEKAKICAKRRSLGHSNLEINFNF